MRVICILLFVICITIASDGEAEWYIIDSTTNRCTSITQYRPDQKDLDSRGEFSVFEQTPTVALTEAEYFEGKIRQRVKSQSEINEYLAAIAEAEEVEAVRKEMFTQAYKSLKEKNKDQEFKHLDKYVNDKEAIDNAVKTQGQVK